MPFVGTLEDRSAIRELLETYADAVMRSDTADWAGTWSDDNAEWHIAGHPSLSEVRGKLDIVDAWWARMQQIAWIRFESSVGSIVIQGEFATVRSYASEAFGIGGETRRAFGRYDDELVREEAGWRFRVRRLTTIARD
ncbi:MAG: hypothetical protein JWO25_17 [Alphaproteobacteria bacterium]|nr:hypothetical protein [Alphaproteobacteria bacterium]